MWKHVHSRLVSHARTADGMSARRARTTAVERRITLVEILADIRTDEKRTKAELLRALRDLKKALQSTVDTLPVSYTSSRSPAGRVGQLASELLPLVREERAVLQKTETTGNDAIDAVMNMQGVAGRPAKARAMAVLAVSYGLDPFDLSRLESVMIVGVSDLAPHLRLPAPDNKSVGLYLSTEAPVFAQMEDLRSRKFTAKWTAVFDREHIAYTKPSP